MLRPFRQALLSHTVPCSLKINQAAAGGFFFFMSHDGQEPLRKLGALSVGFCLPPTCLVLIRGGLVAAPDP